MFSTHRHELNKLASLKPNVANFQVLVEEMGDDLICLHRVSKVGARRSYGIEAESGRSAHPRRAADSADIGSAVRQ